MKAYKVFHKCLNKELCSLFTFNKAEVYYKKDCLNTAPKWLAEKGYHPVAFKTLKDVELACRDWKLVWDYEIWEVELKGVVKKLPVALSYINISRGFIDLNNTNYWTKGTVMGKKVRLVRRVK